jgi:peptidoglycan/LPS O-acetylase OafA/YrhL
MAGALATIVLLAMQQTSSTLDLLYYSIPGRLIEFGVGFALGYAGRVVPAQLRRAALAGGVVGFVLLSGVANRAGGFTDLLPAVRLAIYVAAIGFGVLLLLAVDHRPKPSRSRVVMAVSAVGSWSYSTYLWHMVVLKLFVVPLLFVEETALGRAGALLAGMAIMIAVVLVLSWASFNLIERPFLSMRPNYIRDDAPTERSASAAKVTDLLARTLRARASGEQSVVPAARRPVPESVGAGGRS